MMNSGKQALSKLTKSETTFSTGCSSPAKRQHQLIPLFFGSLEDQVAQVKLLSSTRMVPLVSTQTALLNQILTPGTRSVISSLLTSLLGLDSQRDLLLPMLGQRRKSAKIWQFSSEVSLIRTLSTLVAISTSQENHTLDTMCLLSLTTLRPPQQTCNLILRVLPLEMD